MKFSFEPNDSSSNTTTTPSEFSVEEAREEKARLQQDAMSRLQTISRLRAMFELKVGGQIVSARSSEDVAQLQQLLDTLTKLRHVTKLLAHSATTKRVVLGDNDANGCSLNTLLQRLQYLQKLRQGMQLREQTRTEQETAHELEVKQASELAQNDYLQWLHTSSSSSSSSPSSTSGLTPQQHQKARMAERDAMRERFIKQRREDVREVQGLSVPVIAEILAALEEAIQQVQTVRGEENARTQFICRRLGTDSAVEASCSSQANEPNVLDWVQKEEQTEDEQKEEELFPPIQPTQDGTSVQRMMTTMVRCKQWVEAYCTREEDAMSEEKALKEFDTAVSKYNLVLKYNEIVSRVNQRHYLVGSANGDGPKRTVSDYQQDASMEPHHQGLVKALEQVYEQAVQRVRQLQQKKIQDLETAMASQTREECERMKKEFKLLERKDNCVLDEEIDGLGYTVKGLLNGLRQDLVRRRQDRIARKNLNYQMKYDVSGWLDARSYEGMEMVGNRYFKRLFE